MSKKLVAYFSASKGKVTAHIATVLADVTGADIFEIKPEVLYSGADLLWVNPLARCNREKFGKKDVPIMGEVKNMADYDVLYIGFPIWYGSAPNIIITFLKAYDLAGKKIALFATSGGSGMGKTIENLKPFAAGAELVSAMCFNAGDTRDMLKSWAEMGFEDVG